MRAHVMSMFEWVLRGRGLNSCQMQISRYSGIVLMTIVVISGPAVAFGADDGPLFQRNLSGTPELHTEHAALNVMPLYVPAQGPDGEPPDTDSEQIEYYIGDCTSQDTSGCELVYARPEAKPQIATFLDGDVTFVGDLAFVGHGERDAFAALSLDDGASWKTVNLSRSGDRSSFRLRDRTDYPGDVIGISSAVVGNRVVVAWMSRYCDHGNPLHSWLEEEKGGLLAAYPELDHPVNVEGGTDPEGFYQVYMDDLFSVDGMQGSSDFADEDYPEVGEVPYACLWTARGTLELALDDDAEPRENSIGEPIYEITWRAAERLTSGVRDVNLVQVEGTANAGFAIIWQEDPDGLRPGKALCADGGFNGSLGHEGTDIWYSFLDWDHFGDVCLDEVEDVYCTPGTLADYGATELFGEERPVAAVPWAMPVRLSDSEQCKGVQKFDTDGELIDPYCYADFDATGTADACATTKSWTNPGGTTLDICVTEDGRHLWGRYAATRARLAMKPYDSDADGMPDSAWVVLIHERNKALGSDLVDPTDPDSEPIDIGKDIWYRTFEINNPEIVGQGMMLNGPAVDRETGGFFPVQVDEWGNEFYETEISRHGGLAVQGTEAALASEANTSALLLYKQGILNQGGPADVFIRRVVLPEVFDPAVDNPFAYENVQCVEFDDAGVSTPVDLLYPDGANPNYVRGLCPVEGMNVSGTTIVECDDGSSGDACAASFPWDADEDENGFPKVTEWVQTADNLNDASWENPYDVSRGHQAYIDGDFVLVLYSTAPNWKSSTIGNEAYNLYARRSFDGGQTWTTLPASFSHIDGVIYNGDGTETCEDYGWGGQVEEPTCTSYSAGEFEQARNLSRLTGAKVTVIDPTFSPTGGELKEDFSKLQCFDDAVADGAGDWVNCGYTEAPYPEEIRDPSAFFVAYGTADNTTLPEADVEPISIFYGRASNFGDDHDQQDVCDPGLEDPWYPSTGNQCQDGVVDLRFDWLAFGKRIQPADARVTANPAGERLYAVWSQENYDRRGNLDGVDAWWRRIFYDLVEE